MSFAVNLDKKKLVLCISQVLEEDQKVFTVFTRVSLTHSCGFLYLNKFL